MENFSKVLEIEDYGHLQSEEDLFEIFISKFNQMGIPYYFQHQHRMWEYCMALSAIFNHKLIELVPIRVLDVGGAGSLFGAVASTVHNIHVLQVDPDDHGESVAKQRAVVGDDLEYIRQDFFEFETDELFDVVTCLSVIEHVPDDAAFVKRLLSKVKPGGLLILTMDFHPSGEARSPWHLRTYNADSLFNLYVKLHGASALTKVGDSDYSNYKALVHDWTFASLMLKKDQ